MAGNIDIKIEVNGVDRLVLALAAKPVGVELALRQFVVDTSMFVQMAARGHVNQRTGNLFKNIATELHHPGPGHFVGVVGVQKSAPYGKWVEEGTGLHSPTKPHWIYPRSGNFMIWDEKGAFATRYQGRFVTAVTIKKGRRRKVDTPAGKQTIRVGQHFRIYAKRTRGQKGQRFMHKAYIEAANVYIPLRAQALADKTGSV